MGRFKGKRTKRRYLTNKKPYLLRGQEIQDAVQSPFKSHLRKSQNTVHHPIELLVHHPKRQFVLKYIHRKESSDFLRRKTQKQGLNQKY